MKKMTKNKQFSFQLKGVKPEPSEHGGSIKNPQKRKRPLGLRSTTHLVLRSSQAKKDWSLACHRFKIDKILRQFSKKFGIQILNHANVGNHLHLHLKMRSRRDYKSFIRAVTSAIATKVTGYSRWNKAPEGFKFWDQRPFSRIVSAWSDMLNTKNYVELNRWEGLGMDRAAARVLIRRGWLAPDLGSG